ncbi:MAG: hypothetical protein KKF27_20305 [Gammaproteobacteria bacterium]|nr:hypothetical protein [Gammaproteobacteria bacterium]
MARLELEVGTDVLLLEIGDALLLEGVTTFDETNKLARILIALTDYQLDVKLLLETGDVLLLETGDALLLERSQVHSELTESELARLLAIVGGLDLAEVSDSELTILLAILYSLDLAELSEAELGILLAILNALDLAELSETELSLLLAILDALDLAELSETEITLLLAILSKLDLAELSEAELIFLQALLEAIGEAEFQELLKLIESFGTASVIDWVSSGDFKDLQTGATIIKGKSPARILLNGTVTKGDPIGFSDGWKRASNTIPIRCVAGERGQEGQFVVAYFGETVMEGRFLGGNNNNSIYISSSGKYDEVAPTTLGNYNTIVGNISSAGALKTRILISPNKNPDSVIA